MTNTRVATSSQKFSIWRFLFLFGVTVCVFGIALSGFSLNFSGALYWLFVLAVLVISRRLLRRVHETKRGTRFAVILVAVLAVLVAFFYPKYGGGGGSSALGVRNTSCRCLGVQRNVVFIGPWHSTCYGVPYACTSEVYQ